MGRGATNLLLVCCLISAVHSFRGVRAAAAVAPLRRVLQLRGGAVGGAAAAASSLDVLAGVKGLHKAVTATPTTFFNAAFTGLLVLALALKSQPTLARLLGGGKQQQQQDQVGDVKPAAVQSLQARFLVVFWLMRMADWLQGPYFYEVYSSKVIGGVPVSLDLVSKLFLVGFASTGLFGPWIGKLVDGVGRKAGTLAFAALYTLGALSTRSSLLPLLLLGRVAGGVGTSLLFSAPEAWLVGEHQREKHDGKWLGETFGLAYAGDALVAIAAGQLASMTAAKAGPTGPFTASVLFLAIGSLIASATWGENVAATSTGGGGGAGKKPTIPEALEVMKSDKKILLVGAMQALFEGAMYIFVLQWCPAIKAAIQASPLWGGAGAAIPFGKIFSCFMVNCLLGTTLFGAIRSRGVSVERSSVGMMLAAATAMLAATRAVASTGSLSTLIAAFFAFEACVGMYFPSIGTLRSKYVPDSHRSVIMNIFGLPLNIIVVGVFLSIKYLGVTGALSCATGALALASACAVALARESSS